MTDQQTYTKDDGAVLLELSQDWRSANNGKLLVKLPIVSAHDSVVIPAARLLAMIDAADPDAMRAYLRETVEREIPAGLPVKFTPDAMRAYLREILAGRRCPASAAAEHFDYLDAVPEADSPEDIDEHPAPAKTERLALLEQVAEIYPTMPPRRHIAVVEWIIDGIEVPENVVRSLDGLDR